MVSVFSLFALAALWGSSFLFMRIAALPMGPAMMIEMRVALAALTLLIVAVIWRKRLAFFSHVKHYVILGLFSTALPFILIAYAAQTLNASTLSILNSTAPIWGALIGAVWGRNRVTRKVFLGLGLGVLGVSVLVGKEARLVGLDAIVPMCCSVLAAFCYGIATNYTKYAPKVPSFNNAHGSMWAATLLLLPLAVWMPAREPLTWSIGLPVLALGVFCTGLAYVLYFRLIDDIGPASALSVTFLVPVFGILWGHLFLGEPVGWNTLIGTLLVLSGTSMVTGFSVSRAIQMVRRADS